MGSRTVAPETTDIAETETAAATTAETPSETTAPETTGGADIKVEKTEQAAEGAAETKEQAKENDINKPQTIYYCGSALTEAIQQYPESELTVSTPIQDGIVKDWASMEALW